MKKKHDELLNILKNQTGPVSSRHLAELMHISPRSVKNYVREINSAGQRIRSDRHGYTLNPDYYIESHSRKEFNLPQTSEERSFYIIKALLLEHREPLEIFDICEELALGYSTVKTLVSRMNKTYIDYQVSFAVREDRIFIRGSERAKRKLIRFVIVRESKTSFRDFSQLVELFPELDVEGLYHFITNLFRNHEFYLNDFSAMNILLHLLILIRREQNSGNVEPAVFSCQSGEEVLVSDICTYLSENMGVSASARVRESVLSLVRSNTTRAELAAWSQIEESAGQDILLLVKELIEKIGNIYFVDLTSPRFAMPFALHLQNLQRRYESGSFLDNPMTSFIRKNNPTVYEIATWIRFYLKESRNITINEDETAFLALHIGSEIERQNADHRKIPVTLVCPDYRDLRAQLVNQLMLDFSSQLHVESIVSSEDEIEENQYALILSTIPLKKGHISLSVEVSPFQIRGQKERIEDAMEWMEQRYLQKTVRDSFDRYFRQDLFLYKDKSHERDEILKEACRLLQIHDCVEGGFEADVIARENASSTAFGNIAIPHSVRMDALQTSVCVVICPEGINWKDQVVYLVLLLAINPADRYKFQILYESLINLFAEPGMLHKVRQCRTCEQFRTLVFPLMESVPVEEES